MMNPDYVQNDLWWTEPTSVQIDNNYFYLKHIERLINNLPFYQPTPEISIAELD